MLRPCPHVIISYISKASQKMLKRILRLTVYELLCILIILFFFVVLVIWRNDDINHRYYDVSLETKHRESDSSVDDDNKTKVETVNHAIVWWTTGMRLMSATKVCGDLKCDIFSRDNRHKPANVAAYLFYASSMTFEDLPLPRQPEKTVWGLFHEESPRNLVQLTFEKALNLFNYSTTFSRYSDVPFPLQYMGPLESVTSKEFFVNTRVKNSLLHEISPILYLQSDCDTMTERDAYVKELMKFIKIDSYGTCLNNKQLPSHLKDDYMGKLFSDEVFRFIARYKFVLAIENGVCDDYITEKFWRPIKVGAVPIYFGSPSIRDWLPNNKSAILLDDFHTPKLLSEHINTVISDDDLYEEYLEHKTKGIITNKRLVDELKERPYQVDTLETITEFECFICKKLHDNKHKIEVNVVNKSHYNCPEPFSALTLAVNPVNPWVAYREYLRDHVEATYNEVMTLSKNMT